MSEKFDPYHEWLGIPASEQPPHHYRLLAITAFEENPTVIENAADQRMAHLRTFQTGKHGLESQRLLNEVSTAKICLLNPAQRAVYDARLRQQLEAKQAAQTPAIVPIHLPVAVVREAPAVDPGLDELFAEIGKQEPRVAGQPAKPWSAGHRDGGKAAIPPRYRVLAWLAIGGAAAGLVFFAAMLFRLVSNPGTVTIKPSAPTAPVDARVDAGRPATPAVDEPVPERAGRLAIPAVDGGPAALGLSVDGEDRDVPRAKVRSEGNVWQLAVPTGRHVVRIWRSGFVPLEQEMDFAAGNPKLWSPVWEPAPKGDRGLIAQLYDGRNFEKFIKTRIDKSVEWFWKEGSPDPLVPVDNFSVRWIGWIKPPIAGRYRFRALADDGARIWIDGKPLFYEMRAASEGDVNLDARPHAVRIEYFEATEWAGFSWQWACLGLSTYQAVPAAVLFPNRKAAEAAKVGQETLAMVDAKSVPDAQGRINLLKLIDPLRETIHGMWWFDDLGLISGAQDRTFLNIPFTPPAEYDLEIVAQRKNYDDAFIVGLVAGGHRFQVVLDGLHGSVTGVEMIDGARAPDNETRWNGKALLMDRPVTLIFEVRRSHLTVKRDGETLVDWPADYGRCRSSPDWTPPGGRFLTLGCWHSNFLISRMDLRPVSAEEQSFAEESLQRPQKSLDAPRDLPAGKWIDVLPYVDAEGDAYWGTWYREGDGLLTLPEWPSKLTLPLVLEGSYEIGAEFTRHNGRDDVALLLPVGLHQAMLSLSGWGGDAGGLGFIDGQSARDHALGVRPSPLENGRRYTLRVKVTLAGEQASIDSFLDDKPFTHFRGQQASLSLEHKWGLRETGRPAIAAWASTVTFHRVRVRGGSGAGCVLDGKRSRREPYVQTPEVLGGGGMRFHDLAPEGSRLIGLRVAATSALNSLQPIYRGAAETLGTLHGAAKDDPVELRAKTGYAVGAVVTKTGGSIDGMRVVFFRDKGDRLDPSDRYESDWLGGRGGDQEMTYGGNGQPVVGVYGTADTDFHALGLMLVRGRDQDPAAPSAGMVSLTRLKPLRTTVGGWAFAVMRPEDRLWSFSESQPYVPEHLEYCKEFLFAHAPSRVVYALPPEAKSFSAVGYCAVSADVKFRVLFDGQVKYESPRAGVVPISVDVPPGAKTLEMVVDDLGNNSYDWSHWLEPRLYPCSAAQIGGSKAGNPVKLTERQPLSVSVGYYVLYVNQAPSPTPPPHFDRVEPCNELLFAHSPSHLTYAIPPGAREFTAIGHNVRSTTVKFRVFVDGQGAYESPLAGIVPIRVPLADGAKRLDLIVDDFDGNSMDHSFWCYPRFQGQMSLAK